MTELEEVLLGAQQEIISLRRQNELLRAKVEVMDLFACVLHTTAASRSEGMSIDIAWQLGKELEKLKAATPNPADGGGNGI